MKGEGALARPLDFLAPRRASPRRSTTRSKISAFTKPRTSSTTFSGAISATGTSSGSSRNWPSADREVALAAWRNLFAAFESALRLLHPFMPFLTEELWHQLPQPAGARSIALDRFPEPRAEWADAGADEPWRCCRKSSSPSRNIRAEMKLDPKKKVAAEFSTATRCCAHLVEDNLDPILRLAVAVRACASPPAISIPTAPRFARRPHFDLRIAYGDAVDKPAEIARLRKEIERLDERHRVEASSAWPTKRFAAAPRAKSSTTCDATAAGAPDRN